MYSYPPKVLRKLSPRPLPGTMSCASDYLVLCGTNDLQWWRLGRLSVTGRNKPEVCVGVSIRNAMAGLNKEMCGDLISRLRSCVVYELHGFIRVNKHGVVLSVGYPTAGSGRIVGVGN